MLLILSSPAKNNLSIVVPTWHRHLLIKKQALSLLFLFTAIGIDQITETGLQRL